VQVVRQVFGSGAFETIFGDVTDLPMFQTIFQMVDGREGALASSSHTSEAEFKAEQSRILKEEEEERCRRLSVFLLANLEGKTKDAESFVERARAEASMLVDTPGGVDLVSMTAFIYSQEGTQFRGGVEGFLSEVSEKAHYTYEGTGILGQAFGVMRAAQKLNPQEEETGGKNTAMSTSTEENREKIQGKLEQLSPEELQKVQQEVMAQGLDTLWRLGKLLLEERLRRICEMALEEAHNECPGAWHRVGEFFTTGSLSEVRINLLADALCKLGEVFYEVANAKKLDDGADDEADYSGFAGLKEAAGVSKKKPPDLSPQDPRNSSSWTEVESDSPKPPAGYETASAYGHTPQAPPESYPERGPGEKVENVERLQQLPIKALRGVLQEYGVDTAGCVEKSELVNLIVEKLGMPVVVHV